MSDAIQTRHRLLATLEKVRKSVGQVRGKKEHIGETQTKASLINPVLQALGWDITDLDEVALEYRHKPQDNPVDYALFSLHQPRLFVEAKALDTNLDDHKWVSQTVNYANAAGVAWCVLTDGDKWAIYNTHAPVAVEQKLFRIVSCTDTAQEAFVLDSLELLSKEQLSGNTIERLWEAYFVDCTVERVVRELFDGLDNNLVNLVRRKATALKPAQIRESLRRADLRLDFPVFALPPPPVEPDLPVNKSRLPAVEAGTLVRGSRVKVQHLLDAGLVKPGDKWRCSKGKGLWVYAEVRADGRLLLDGAAYASPSAAGSAATGWSACDGWRCWQCQDATGAWQPIDRLREQVSGTAEGAPSKEPSPRGGPFTVSGHLSGKPVSLAAYEALVQRVRETIGEFTVHANSKHIVFTNRSAFLVLLARKDGLRFGLRLPVSLAESHPRLQAQPKGIFEGWSALHLSTTVSDPSEVDGELLSLIRESHSNAG